MRGVGFLAQSEEAEVLHHGQAYASSDFSFFIAKEKVE